MKKKTIAVGMLLLFMGLTIAPTISSTITPEETQTTDKAFYANIVRPVRALYVNDQAIWTFKLIQRGIVFGDITINVEAVDDTHGIDYVEFRIDTILTATVTEPPYSYLWNEWRPGFHLLDARAFNNNGSYVDAESFQIIKFG